MINSVILFSEKQGRERSCKLVIISESKFSISVCRTYSSTVTTTRSFARKRRCSARIETTTKVSLRSQIVKGLPHAENLVCHPILVRDGGNIGSVLSPHDVSLMKAVKPRKPGESAVPPPLEKNKKTFFPSFFAVKRP